MGESEELASESLWQTAEIRNAKPNWTSFANSSLLSTGCAARRVSMPCLHCCACAHCGVANSLRAGRALSAAMCVGHTSSRRKIRCGRAADYSQRRAAPRMLNIFDCISTLRAAAPICASQEAFATETVAVIAQSPPGLYTVALGRRGLFPTLTPGLGKLSGMRGRCTNCRANHLPHKPTFSARTHRCILRPS